jgi:predicted DNA-binding transcriptional regulator AlpA
MINVPRPEVTGRKIPRAAFTIPEFCAAHGFSRATFYNMQAKGEGPAVMHVLGRVLISAEAAQEWRRQRTEAAAAAMAARLAGDLDPEEDEEVVALELERGAPGPWNAALGNSTADQSWRTSPCRYIRVRNNQQAPPLTVSASCAL